jgi:DNA-binding beta-propeller fold protein YncE
LLASAGGQNRFREPWGVATDAQGNVYVADTWAHRIQKLDPNLQPLLAWGGPPAEPNAPNPSPLELFGPRAIAVDGAGDLWVTDTGHHRVLKFSAEGQPLGAFGSFGIDKGQFREPVGIAIAPNGDILVADTWNGRVQRFDSAFRFLGEFRVEGWDDRNTENKPYLTALADGSVLAGVPDGGVVRRYGADGRLLATWDQLGDTPAGSRPLGLAADSQGRFWVSDAASGEIVRLAAR